MCGIKHQASYFSVLWMLCKGRRRIAYMICLIVSPCFCPCKLHITAPEIVHLLPWRERLIARAIYASLTVEIVSVFLPWGSHLSVHGDNICPWRYYVSLYFCPWGSHFSVHEDINFPWRLCLYFCPWISQICIH
jgi:hypothetical protein